jgi:hypothetical protein
MRPRRYRLRLTVWLIRRIIAALDLISDWEFRLRYPHG